METGPHTGIFEGTAKTGELPAGALASDTAIDHSPLMAIDQDPKTSWLSEPDGATPKWLSVDMKDLREVEPRDRLHARSRSSTRRSAATWKAATTAASGSAWPASRRSRRWSRWPASSAR